MKLVISVCIEIRSNTWKNVQGVTGQPLCITKMSCDECEMTLTGRSRVVTVFVAVTGRYSCGPQQRWTRPLTTKKLRLLSASTTTNYIITDWPHRRDTYYGQSSFSLFNVSASTKRGVLSLNVSWIIIHWTSQNVFPEFQTFVELRDWICVVKPSSKLSSKP